MKTARNTILLSLVLGALPIAAPARAELAKIELQPFLGNSMGLPLPGGARVELASTAVLTIADKKLVLDDRKQELALRRFQMFVDGKRGYFVLEYKQTVAAEKERHRVSMWNVPGKTDLDLQSTISFAAVDLEKHEVLWRQQVSNMDLEGTWDLVQAPDAFYVRVLLAAYAIDKRDGRVRWVLSDDATSSTLNDRYLLSWKAHATSLVFDCQNRVDFDDHKKEHYKLEVDLQTGNRVFRETSAPKLVPTPVYIYERHTMEYRGDRPSPQLPRAWDGLRLERTLFLWNKQTLEGVIIDPQLAILPKIIDLAQHQKVDGKNIRWKYVVDLFGAIRELGSKRKAEVLAGYKDEFMGDNEILISSPGLLEHSGEKIVAAELAKKLGAQTLPAHGAEKLTLQAAPLFLFRDDHVSDRTAIADSDIPYNIKLKWGPYVIHERTREKRE